jgi:primary-amine oxidase
MLQFRHASSTHTIGSRLMAPVSEHQFWVTPYDPAQRYAAGTYPTSSKGTDGLAVWTQANRPIDNTEDVGLQ